MGVAYVPMLLDDDMRRWLESEGVASPERDTPSRWPTPRELRAVLTEMNGCDVTYRDNTDGGWDAEVVERPVDSRSQHATIWTKQLASTDVPAPFSFHKSSVELALVILERLSHVCGPLVLVDDSTMAPMVVTPGCDVRELARRHFGTPV